MRDANGNSHGGDGRFDGNDHTPSEVHLSQYIDPDIVRSRRNLIDVITALGPQREALTVLGAHAVIEVTQGIPNLPPDDATQDGDLGVTPALLVDEPLLSDVLSSLGYEAVQQARPGVWSPIAQRDLPPHSRDTIDLIAPFEVSYPEGTKPPRRGAKVGEHGSHSVSATRGTELSLVDRSLRMIRSFDDGPDVEGYVAGAAALLCAKAYKLHDRMNPQELERNPQRLRPKDFADVYRLMLAISPEKASELFTRGEVTARIGGAVAEGRMHLIEVLNDAEQTAAYVANAWSDLTREAELADYITQWRRAFIA